MCLYIIFLFFLKVTVAQRGNFCSQMKAFQSGGISLTNALSGQTVSIGYNIPQKEAFYLAVNSSSSAPTGGYNMALLNTIAQLGNITFKFVPVRNQFSGETYTTYLQNITNKVDVFAGYKLLFYIIFCTLFSNFTFIM